MSKCCTLCNSGEIGDEFHYIFICNKFNDARKIYVDKYYRQFPNTIKMNELFNSNRLSILKKLVQFIKLIEESCL